MNEKVVVVGAGAIGGITGAVLFDNGVDVVLVDKNKDHVDAINKEGFHIDGLEKDRFVKIKAFTDVADAGSNFDLAILAVKDIHNNPAGHSVIRTKYYPNLSSDFMQAYGTPQLVNGTLAVKIQKSNQIKGGLTWRRISKKESMCRVPIPNKDPMPL